MGRPPLPPQRHSKPRYKKKKPDFSIASWMNAITGESDGAFIDKSLPDVNVVIVAVTTFDRFLTWLILLHVGRVPGKNDVDAVFTYPGPLSSFSSKIDLCYLMGHINDDMKRNLNSIRWIRNQFCHTNRKRSFSDPDVVTRCNSLYMGKLTPAQLNLIELGLAEHGSPARVRFYIASIVVMITLLGFFYKRLEQAQRAVAQDADITRIAQEKLQAWGVKRIDSAKKDLGLTDETFPQEAISLLKTLTEQTRLPLAFQE